MKRILLALLVFAVLSGTLGAQEETPERTPTGAVSFVLTSSFAPIGLGGELFLGKLGVGATFTTLPFGIGGADDTFVLIYEPGLYGRFYPWGPADSFFVTAGASFLSAFFGDTEEVSFLDGKLVKFKFGTGYNVLFGDDNQVRFSFEIGGLYRTFIIEDENADSFFPLLPYATLMFGPTF